MPVVLIVGTEDKFVPPESYRPFLDAVGSDDATVVEFPTGHVGISVAPEAHEEYWPGVRERFAERSAEQ
jgi:polyhydroxyalkanoate synthase